MDDDVEALRARFLDAWRAYQQAAGLPDLAGAGRFPGEPVTVPLPEMTAVMRTLTGILEHAGSIVNALPESDPRASADAIVGLVGHLRARITSWRG